MYENRTIINLNSILDFTTDLYQSVDENFILNSTLLSLMGKLKVMRGAILTKDSASKSYTPLIIKGNLPLQQVYIEDINEFQILSTELEIEGIDKNLISSIVPLKNSKNITYAIILLGKSFSEESISDDEIKYINLITTIAANAIDNARNFNSYRNEKIKVEKQNQLLKTLFEISKDFSIHHNSKQITRTLAYNLMGQLSLTRFVFYSINDDNKCEVIINRFDTEISAQEMYLFSQIEQTQIINQSFLDKISSEIHFSNNYEAIIPIYVQGIRKGFILAGKKLNNIEFSDEDIQFIESIGNTAMSALENERLFHEELEKKSLEKELSIALEIQKKLLPKESPRLKNYDIAGISLPSRHVGGDLFDFIPLDNDRYLITIADVSGKGMPASLIMANFQAALKVLARSKISLKEIVVKLNSLLYENTGSDKFVTAFFAIIDDNSREIQYINAGHNPPLLKRKDNSIETLSTGGLILGFLEQAFPYQYGETTLNSGDFIILYTDGVSEASIDNIEEFGEELIEEYALDTKSNNAEDIMNGLIYKVRKYLDNTPANDDITVIAISRK